MKRIIFAAAVLAFSGLMVSGCESSGGGGGSLFSASYEKYHESWDMMVVLGTTACEKGFAGMGAGIDPSFPGGFFPGLRVLSMSGQIFEGAVPEVKMLAYFVVAPGLVAAGDTVNVHFRYRPNADGEDGDYFLVRIIDGDRFRVPVEVRTDAMSTNTPKNVNYRYHANSEGFGIEFIVGLSQPTDQLYLDELEVRTGLVQAGNTVNYLIKDYFESGNYSVQAMLSPAVIRFPFLPLSPAGTLGLAPASPLQGSQSLLFTGGKYFDLYGQGASTADFAGVILCYTGANPLDPFFGQTMGLKEGRMYLGDYLGFDNATLPVCSEKGNALIAVNPGGNSDLSGLWTLRLDAFCDEPGVMIGETIGPPGAPGEPVSVFRQMMVFGAYPFPNADGDLFNQVMGLSMGSAGIFLLSSTAAGTQAQLIGSYDPETRVFAGQIMGTLPATGAAVCTVSQGRFTAIIDKSVFVPPPI